MQDEALDSQLEGLRRRSQVLLILFVVAMALAIGSAAYAFVSVSSVRRDVAAAKDVVEKIDSGKEAALQGMKPKREVGLVHPLGSFVVNLMDPGNLRYVNCRIEVEVESSLVVKEIQSREAQFKDAVISLLGNQTYDDVLGSEGKSRIREELMVRFNRLLSSGQIARVYLTEFVVQ